MEHIRSLPENPEDNSEEKLEKSGRQTNFARDLTYYTNADKENTPDTNESEGASHKQEIIFEGHIIDFMRKKPLTSSLLFTPPDSSQQLPNGSTVNDTQQHKFTMNRSS